MGSKPSFLTLSSYKFLSTLVLSTALTSTAWSEKTSSHEAFFLKRISGYYKEGDVRTTKNQIEHFLEKYPTSAANDSLNIILAGIYLEEKNYEKALDTYNKLSSEESQHRTFYPRAICLFELKKDDDLIELTTKALASPIKVQQAETMQYFLASALLKKGLAAQEDQKRALFKEALSLLEKLTSSTFAEKILPIAADLAKELGEKEKACHFYKILLEKAPCDREEILYQIASLQENLHPGDAIKTFGQVYKLRGKKASDAAYRQIKNLFHMHKFKELLLYQEEAKRHIAPAKKAMMHYYVGSSLFHLEDFSQAKKNLLAALDEGSFDADQQKALIKNLVICASRTKDYALIQALTQRWEELSPGDLELADAYILCYQLLQNKDLKLSSEFLYKILEKYPSHKEAETILFNLASIEYKLDNLSQASDLFSNVSQKFPSGQYRTQAIRALVKTKTKEVALASEDTLLVKREELIQIIESSLKTKNVFSEDELSCLTFSYAKLLFDSKKYDLALDCLLQYVEDAPDAKNLSEAYFLTALSYEAISNSPSMFISYAEKALEASHEEKNMSALYVKLFNAYLKLADSSSQEEKHELIKKGALHLYSAYKEGVHLKEENIYWLADLLYRDLKTQFDSLILSKNSEMLSNATALFQDFLGIDQYPPKIDFNHGPSFIEQDMLRLADLLGWQGKINEKIDTLEVLVHAQKSSPEKSWKLPRKAQIELARAYKDSNNFDLSLDAYSDIIRSAEYAPSFVATQAKLEKATLEMSILSQNGAGAEDPRWQQALDDLKDLEIQKRIFSEPLHLEAALTYAQYKTRALSGKDKSIKSLSLLEKIKEDFSSRDIKETTAYLEGLQKYPDKAKIYTHYMELVDSLILLQKAEIAKLDHNESSAKEFKARGLVSLAEVGKCQELPQELKDRITQHMEGVDKPL